MSDDTIYRPTFGRMTPASTTWQKDQAVVLLKAYGPMRRIELSNTGIHLETLARRKFGQWRSFLTRDPLFIDEPDLCTVICEVGGFIVPAARATIDDRRTPGRWTSDYGWRPAT